jgi:hypothetical protein
MKRMLVKYFTYEYMGEVASIIALTAIVITIVYGCVAYYIQ